MHVLTVNAGSSSIRLDLLQLHDGGALRRIAKHHRSGSGVRPSDLEALLEQAPGARPSLVAHRVVHGGSRWSGPTLITDEVDRGLEALIPLAPIHQPRALAWIRELRRLLPHLPHLAVFDTAFFALLPAAASSYALPRALTERHHLRRYGFHGLAHAAMWRRWEELSGRGGRVVTLQLGSGCSAAAIEDGRPLETSMGFSPTEGLVMATRSGDVDPGALTYLMRSEGLDADGLDRLLNGSSGLLGLSGITGDMATLSELDAPEAHHAIAVFAHRVKKYLGAYSAVMGGLDGVVFGGGIGEHSPRLRALCMDGLEYLGIRLDPIANDLAVEGDAELHHGHSGVELYSVAVDEAQELARLAVEAHVAESRPALNAAPEASRP